MKKKGVWALVVFVVFISGGCDIWPPNDPSGEGAVTGPVQGGINGGPFTAALVDLNKYGYIEEEFFLQGDAAAYDPKGELGIDGRWGAVPKARKKPFKTRLLVRRPAVPDNFNGTVVVEWLNVTGGFDGDVGFAYLWEELLRGGYAWVGVSVQKAGVDGASVMSMLSGLVADGKPLTKWDTERYGSLKHPGDLYGYDIFSQAGAAIARPGKVDPMQGLNVERLIAYGQSQSAMRLITYVNAVHPLANVFDGFFIQSRAGWGAAVGTESDALHGNGEPVRVRDDINAVVLQFITESELFFPLGPFFAARQPDSQNLRTWEVAGTAHIDKLVLGDDAFSSGCGDTEGAPSGCGIGSPGCDEMVGRMFERMNTGPAHIVAKAGMRAMHLWLKEGKAPPKGEPFAVNAEQDAIARDTHGNALGGVRTPAVDAPIAMIKGEPERMDQWQDKGEFVEQISMLFVLFGSTTPFTSSQLHDLYPTHQDYVDKVTVAAHAAREAGFVLPEEETTIVAEAVAAPIPE